MNTGILGTAFQYTVVIGLLCLDAAIVCAHAPPIPRSRYVVLLDLSKSVAEEEFPKYLAAIEHLLEQMHPGTAVTVVGITENSFGNPRLLLNERLTDPEGRPDELKPNDCEPLRPLPIDYAKCRSDNARKKQAWDKLLYEHRKKEKDKIISRWRQEGSLQPYSDTTDVLGALKYAERLLENNGMGSKVLCILSDMRHVTKHLDLESGAVRLEVLDGVRDKIPRLDGVSIRICGVHTRKKTPEYWKSLREFWEHFLQDTGGTLEKFHMEIHPCCEIQR